MIKYFINSAFGSFFRTLGRIVAYILFGALIVYLSQFINITSVKALENTIFGTIVSEHGNFNSMNNTNSWTDSGYLITDYDYGMVFARPSISFTYGNFGGILTQCDMSLLNGNYYSITYYFGSASNSNYFYPFYSWAPYKLGISNSTASNLVVLNFNPEANSTDVQQFAYQDLLVNTYTLIFKANVTGTCLSSVIDANGSQPSDDYNFLGYNLTSLGSNLSSEDISNALSDEFNNINAQFDSLNTSVYQFQQEQQETNDLISSESDDFESKNCGILCKIKKIPTLIIDGLKGLFIPENMDFVTDFVNVIENKLGFIAEVPIRIIEFILNLATATWDKFDSISFPSISIFGYNFWNAQEIDLTEAINIFEPFKYVTDVICVVICARTLNKWREQFTGGN